MAVVGRWDSSSWSAKGPRDWCQGDWQSEGSRWEGKSRGSASSRWGSGWAPAEDWEEQRGWRGSERFGDLRGEQRRHERNGAAWKAEKSEGAEAGDERAAAEVAAAKARLVGLRPSLSAEVLEELSELLRAKPATLQLRGFGAPDSAETEALRCVLERDTWEGKPCGANWLQEWIREGLEWFSRLTLPSEAGEFWCHLCWKNFGDAMALQSHCELPGHQKKLRNWRWRQGREPPLGRSGGASSSSSGPDVAREMEVDEDASKVSALNARATEKAKSKFGRMKPPELLAWARGEAAKESAQAKRKLVEYRNKLSEAERSDILRRIGLRRANDIPSVDTLREVFGDEIFEWMEQVNDPKWLYKEPTFSWLTGFYWHPDSTTFCSGPAHGERYCHLCEMECYDESTQLVHSTSRRHADSVVRWVERYGALEMPSSCARCPGAQRGGTEVADGHDGPHIDLEVRRAEREPEVGVPEEAQPPCGFESTHEVTASRRVEAQAYVSFVVAPPRSEAGRNRRWKADGIIRELRVSSSRLKIGPKDKKSKQGGWTIDLQAPLSSSMAEWRSLLVPLQSKQGTSLEFRVQAKWGDTDDFVDAGALRVVSPSAGYVEEVSVQLAPRDDSWNRGWQGNLETSSRSLWVMDAVGTAQIDAMGGLAAMRGQQRAIQYATQDLLMSCLLYVPCSEDPAPLLIFLHGDMVRDTQNCPQPGLADFCNIYGPAELVKTEKKRTHPAREFVVATPSCSGEYWWFRYPSRHDTKAYVAAIETWFRRFIAWTQELGLTPSEGPPVGGIRIAGQSMGGYAALELARAMPENVAAVAAGAPCFDACRLDWLADRMVNVPVWLMIGRQDTLCSFEEIATLALKLKSRGAKCVRLSSQGIKGHNEACTRLEKPALYRWLKDPLSEVSW